LPTVSEALRNTNMCIISALCSLSQGTSVLSHSLSDNLPKIGLLLTSEFIEVIKEIEEVPEEPTLDHHHPGGDDGKINDLNDSIGNLKHMLETYSEKLKKSEQKKEHWKLECQLLQMKLDKLKLVDGDADNAGDHDHQVVGETPGAANERIEELVAEKLMADSKATHFYLECGSMQKRIKFWEKAKKKAEDDLKLAHNDIEELEEESKTTTVNYDGQLSMMSEHLANMNEKLTMQTDEIDRLKYELSSSSAGGKK
jgi:chromosome segregation ATPase